MLMWQYLLPQRSNNSIKCSSNICEISYTTSNQKSSFTTIWIRGSTLQYKRNEYATYI